MDKASINIMDFKPDKFNRGEMVRFHFMSEKTLGIVKGQDGGKVEVEWVLWESDSRVVSSKPQSGWYPIYKLKRVVSQD